MPNETPKVRTPEGEPAPGKATGEQKTHERSKIRSTLRFFNSRLGILLVGAVVIPALGGGITHVEKREAERIRMNRKAMRLKSEFGSRLAKIEFFMNKIPGGTNDVKYGAGVYIWRTIIGEVYGESEFRKVRLVDIVTQLRELGYEENAMAATQTINDMEHGNEAVHLSGQPRFEDHTYDVANLRKQLEVLKQFQSRVLPKARFWDLLF